MLDVRIVGGRVVDGTGSAAREATLAIRDSVIVPDDGTTARRTIDATGLIVAPGFIDLHTHYDAQLFWDPLLSPSPQHGVTTVVAGNCGFTLAPMNDAHIDYIGRMLARVEGMPFDTLRESVPWNWSTTADYLAAIERRGIGPIIGFLAGHSTIRRQVMGDRAVGEKATSDDVAAMVRLLQQSLAGGALGLSTSQAETQPDGDDRPVPSRWATDEELLALATEVRDQRGTMLQYAPPGGRLSDDTVGLMIALSLAADRPINWNLLIVNRYDEEFCNHQLSASDRAAARGAVVKGLVRPDASIFRVTMLNATQTTTFRDWGDVLNLPPVERRRAARDPDVRQRLRSLAEARASRDVTLEAYRRWADYTISDTVADENASLAGRRVGDVAAERGRDPFDVLLDIVVADDFATGFYPTGEIGGAESWRARAALCADARLLVGGSDAGGHLDLMCGPVYTTSMLRELPRRGLLPIEECIRLLTDVPARYAGMRDRGRLAPGYRADVVIIDAESVGPAPFELRRDLPAQGNRVYADARGIERVLVNGVELVCVGQDTGARPGTVIRSGRDTHTVSNSGPMR